MNSAGIIHQWIPPINEIVRKYTRNAIVFIQKT